MGIPFSNLSQPLGRLGQNRTVTLFSGTVNTGTISPSGNWVDVSGGHSYSIFIDFTGVDCTAVRFEVDASVTGVSGANMQAYLQTATWTTAGGGVPVAFRMFSAGNQ